MDEVTAETLTDEQLHDLIRWAERTIADARFALLRITVGGETHPATTCALERCAAAINAREKGAK